MAGMKEIWAGAAERHRPRLRLAEAASVRCWCNRCGHAASWPGRRLALMLGPDLAVPEAGARMRCGSCGSKDVATRAEDMDEAALAASAA